MLLVLDVMLLGGDLVDEGGEVAKQLLVDNVDQLVLRLGGGSEGRIDRVDLQSTNTKRFGNILNSVSGSGRVRRRE